MITMRLFYHLVRSLLPDLPPPPPILDRRFPWWMIPATIIFQSVAPVMPIIVGYTIARGDTLSGIAVRYGTSARRIKEVNGLRGDQIRVGQVITIPAG